MGEIKQKLHILIATNNQFKIHEMIWYINDIPNIKIHILSDLNNVPDIEEDGETLLENATKKAVEISKLPGAKDLLVFASDIGGDIPGLGDKWDYRRPKRSMGEFATDEQRARTLIEMMKDLKGEERRFNYPIALVFAKNGHQLFTHEYNSYSGLITETPDFENIGKDRAMGRMLWSDEFGTTEDKFTSEQQNILRIRHQSEVKKKIKEFIATIES